MGYHNILSKLDRALVAYLVHMEAGTVKDVYPAKRSLGKDLPHTACYSEKAKPNLNTGNYTAQVSIIVKAISAVDASEDDADPKAESEGRVADTFDAFFAIEDDTAWDSKKVAAQITAAARAKASADATLDPLGPDADLADFTCLDVRHMGPEATFDEDDVWNDTLNLEVDCCPSNVS